MKVTDFIILISLGVALTIARPMNAASQETLVSRLANEVVESNPNIDILQIIAQIEMAHFRFSQEKCVYIGLSKASRIQERIPGIERVIISMIESGEIIKAFENYYLSRNLPLPAN